MTPTVSGVLRLPPKTRAELAVALWESLSAQDREDALAPGPDDRDELDRRWAEHVANPAAAVPWDVVRCRFDRRA